MKDANVEAKEIAIFKFDTKDFNPYDPHNICKDHCASVYFPWTHVTFYWPEEDPWRYYYNASSLIELVSLGRTWKDAL